MEDAHRSLTIECTIYIKIYLRICIDLPGLGVTGELYSCVLSVSSESMSTRIFLHWSPVLNVYSSVLHHRYINQTLYLDILSAFMRASRWLEREQDDTLESKESPRQTHYRGSSNDTSGWILLSWHYSFCWGETTLLFLIRQVDKCSHCTRGQSVLEYMCRLLGWYCSVWMESKDLLDCVLGLQDYLSRILLNCVH
jgi:hypothetical protein